VPGHLSERSVRLFPSQVVPVLEVDCLSSPAEDGSVRIPVYLAIPTASLSVAALRLSMAMISVCLLRDDRL
jgi:hypothetical protein